MSSNLKSTFTKTQLTWSKKPSHILVTKTLTANLPNVRINKLQLSLTNTLSNFIKYRSFQALNSFNLSYLNYYPSTIIILQHLKLVLTQIPLSKYATSGTIKVPRPKKYLLLL